MTLPLKDHWLRSENGIPEALGLTNKEIDAVGGSCCGHAPTPLTVRYMRDRINHNSTVFKHTVPGMTFVMCFIGRTISVEG
jgi:hypothetical protein